ncbi:MAG TPA: helix-turn-helix domain-containing protein, partial [Micromonosporaceae bacterium]|nr:helix-turn-helix domain-containing protein [Micromonosporaceae bacterium]
VPYDRLNELSARRLSGQVGMSALLSHHLRCLVSHAEQYRPADAARLGTVTLDLVAATLAGQLDHDPAGARASGDAATYARVHAFVERRLGDPELSPRTIAAAQHISTRTLHRIFHAHGTTVGTLIRTRRLERCRHDLADPRRAAESIHHIAERWGFRDAAHFSRTFRAEYGISPHGVRTGQSDLAR